MRKDEPARPEEQGEPGTDLTGMKEDYMGMSADGTCGSTKYSIS